VLHGQAFYPPAEPMVWAIAKTMVRSLFLAGHESVIVDACNNTQKRRDEWKAWDGFYELEFVTVIENLEVMIERCEGDQALIDTINRMAKQHESVAYTEGVEWYVDWPNYREELKLLKREDQAEKSDSSSSV